jgi:hypothetical protein
VYRDQINSEGSPSDTASAGYQWAPGTELATRVQRSSVTPGGRLQS